jgi:hypothetical protein
MGMTLDLGYVSTRRNFINLGGETGVSDYGGGVFFQTALFF